MSQPSPSRRLGPYELIELIGKGGMGEVWRAHDTRLGRDVAVKTSAQQFSDRFEREARAIAALNHPNVCTLFDVGPDYLVMELIEGSTVADRLAQGPIPLDEALNIAGQIASALDAAHEKGIIHRDLKPGNIKIRADGSVKVLDFGLATAGSTGNPVTADSPTLLHSPTMVGMILGTAAYMAPEQARGKVVDKRADIWAFGVVLHEMVVGKRLFEGEDLTETLASVVKDNPDFSAAPPRIQKLLRGCLEKDPRNRLRDIGDWTQLLGSGETITVPPPTTKSNTGWVAAAVLALVAAALGGWMFLGPQPLPPITRFQIFAPPGSTLPLGTPALSPDGRTIAYVVRSADGANRIHVRALNSTESRVLPGTEGAIHPFWSPDGQSVAFAGGSLERVDMAGGSPRVLAPMTGPWHGDWSRSGFILFQSTGINEIAAGGGPLTPILKPDPKKGIAGAGFPIALSDGKRFLARVEHPDGSSNIELFSFDSLSSGTTDSKVVLPNVFSAPLLAPTPRGKTYLFYLNEHTLMAQEFDEKSGTVQGSPLVLIDSIGRVARPAIRPSVGVSASGVLAWQSGGSSTGHYTWFDRSGKVAGQLTGNDFSGSVRLSPDGRFAAATRFNGATQNIWLADLTRGSTSRFTFDNAGENNPVWSPDGKMIAFHRRNLGIYLKESSGAAAEKLIHSGADRLLAWTPDGQHLLILPVGDRRLFLVPVNGAGTEIPVGSQSDVGGADLSPDGKYIAYGSRESGRTEVYVESLPPGKGKWQISIDGGSGPHWRHDGKELFFLAPTRKMMAAEIRLGETVAAGIPNALFQTNADVLNGWDFDVTADGQKFLIFSGATGTTDDSPITVVMNWWVELEGKK